MLINNLLSSFFHFSTFAMFTYLLSPYKQCRINSLPYRCRDPTHSQNFKMPSSFPASLPLSYLNPHSSTVSCYLRHLPPTRLYQCCAVTNTATSLKMLHHLYHIINHFVTTIISLIINCLRQCGVVVTGFFT
jgi:hypothetical protein